MKDRLTKIKNHLSTYRFRYAVGVGITAASVLAVKRAQEWNEFAIEEGVYDAYTTPEVAAE